MSENKLIKVTNGEKEIEVTEKAFRVVYKSLGYRPLKEGAKRGQGRSKKDPALEHDES